MPTIRLSERSVRDLAPQSTLTEVWDEDTTGLGIRVHPSGRKSWMLRYRDSARKWCFKSAGTWPAVKVEEARSWARKALARVALGLPAGQEEQQTTQGILTPALPSVRTLWAEYEARAKTGERRNREVVGRVHVLPAIGDMSVSDLTSSKVDAMVRALSDRPRTGNAVKVHIHGAYELARVLGMFPDDRTNPAARVKGYGYRPRVRLLSMVNRGLLSWSLLTFQHLSLPFPGRSRQKPSSDFPNCARWG